MASSDPKGGIRDGHLLCLLPSLVRNPTSKEGFKGLNNWGKAGISLSKSSSRELRIRVHVLFFFCFFSVAYIRGTLPTKNGVRKVAAIAGGPGCAQSGSDLLVSQV